MGHVYYISHNFYIISLDCGGSITNKRAGDIESKKFPSQIDSNLNCTWTITGSKPNDIIYLEFDALDINDTESNDCNFTYIEITNRGQNGQRFCNSRRPPDSLISSGNQVEIHFVTSPKEHTNSTGFLLKYTIVTKIVKPTTVTPPKTLPTIPGKYDTIITILSPLLILSNRRRCEATGH